MTNLLIWLKLPMVLSQLIPSSEFDSNEIEFICIISALSHKKDIKDKDIINYTLDNIIKSLNPHYFFRISRMCIININSIKIITKHLNGRLKLSLNPEFKEEIYVSRNRVNDFLMWLDGNNSTIQ